MDINILQIEKAEDRLMNLEIGKKMILGKLGDMEKEGSIAHTEYGHQIIREDTDPSLRRDRCTCRLLVALTALPSLSSVFLVETKACFVSTTIKLKVFVSLSARAGLNS